MHIQIGGQENVETAAIVAQAMPGWHSCQSRLGLSSAYVVQYVRTYLPVRCTACRAILNITRESFGPGILVATAMIDSTVCPASAPGLA